MTPEEERQIKAAKRKSQLIVPPLNFAMIAPGVYRSGFPNPKSQPDNDIKFRHFCVTANKEPFEEMDHAMVSEILAVILDTRNHPLLIHCNRGIRRVGCVVGCVRKLQGSSLKVFQTPVHVDPQYRPQWLLI
ncbi:hypothetical protein DL89DRAFT_270688 [Linderina pennispora]|uniref:Protein-tyrosine phosphatase n=1 Tax=Linderina pennispora TaxID=61395 RepID=A0A1Y1VXH1_9FUNG|nr:uncharacterized protein DL89DRAFT_270688 [Linderina pennispora]ORX65735.1 hypothetical protein DL89DRAFT_270688 [Linderina pennispora]